VCTPPHNAPSLAAIELTIRAALCQWGPVVGSVGAVLSSERDGFGRAMHRRAPVHAITGSPRVPRQCPAEIDAVPCSAAVQYEA